MKLTKTFITGLLAVTLCQNVQARSENHEIVDALFAAFNAHDVEKLKTFYSEDAVVYSPETCEPTVGREAIGTNYAELFTYVPDVHDRLDLVVADGNKMAVIFTASSKIHGQEFELPISAFLTIKNGLIVEDRVFFNSDIVLDCDE